MEGLVWSQHTWWPRFPSLALVAFGDQAGLVVEGCVGVETGRCDVGGRAEQGQGRDGLQMQTTRNSVPCLCLQAWCERKRVLRQGTAG